MRRLVRRSVAPFAWSMTVIAGLGALASEEDAGSLDQVRRDNEPTPAAIAAVIDRYIEQRWEEAAVEPAARSSDAEFLRRVSLDLTGSIPTSSATRTFLESDDPEKRRKLIERLLESPGSIRKMTRTWSKLLIPEAGSDQQITIAAIAFDPWLRKKFSEGAGFDEIVRELLTVPLDSNLGFYGFNLGQEIEPTPYAFMISKKGKPEDLAAGTSRIFLGVRLECAQCHDHPFATWTRDEFWGLAAFFSEIENQNRNANNNFFQGREVTDRREIAIPDSNRVVQATFLDGQRPKWRFKDDPREVLAAWVTSPDNPYFAKAMVNRVWESLMGYGLVEPIDEMGALNDPTHPELLDALADAFIVSGFDLKFLKAAITSSRAYQLSSSGYAPGQDDPTLFARMPVRGLTPEQLYDSLMIATGIEREQQNSPFALNSNSGRADIDDRFAEDGSKKTDHRTSILQALTLMNGRLVADATDLGGSGTLTALSDAYFLSTEEKVNAIYLAVLSRLPEPDELARMTRYVDRGGPTLDPKQALSDVFWALLNSAEFVLNH